MQPSKKYELIIFDWDGTLMDSEAQIVACMQRAAKTCQVAIPTDQAVRHIIGLGLKEAVQSLYPSADQTLVKQMFDAYRMHFLSAERPPSALFPATEKVLQTLTQAGYLLAVATGKGRSGLNAVLAETKLADYFVVTRCADETFSKPHPQMLEEILDFTGLEAHQALMVGDTTYDIEMAVNAKMAGLAVNWGVHNETLLHNAGAIDCLTQNMSELITWLK